jgi:hypothetical protein
MMSAFIGKMPVASKLLHMVSTLNEDVQAAQNNGKKSPFFNSQEGPGIGERSVQVLENRNLKEAQTTPHLMAEGYVLHEEGSQQGESFARCRN